MQAYPPRAQVMQSAGGHGRGGWREVDADGFKRTHLSLSCFALRVFIYFFAVNLLSTALATVLPEEQMASTERCACVAGEPRQRCVACTSRVLRRFPGLPHHQAERLGEVLALITHGNCAGPSVGTPANVPGLWMSVELIPEAPDVASQGGCMHHCRLGPLRTPRSICFSSNTSLHLECWPLRPSFTGFLSLQLPAFFPVSSQFLKKHSSPRTRSTLLSFHSSELFSFALLAFAHEDIY